MNNVQPLSKPNALKSVLELRAALDLLSLPVRLSALGFSKKQTTGEGRNVFVLPGFGVSDAAMAPLRFFLTRHGFNTMGWGLGVNQAGLNLDHNPSEISWDFEPPTTYRGEFGVPHLCDLMTEKVASFYKSTGQSVSLVGWSLGGVVAREVARDVPEAVDQVVTMGSPLTGGPKYTSAAPALAKRGLDLNWIEAIVEERKKIPIPCKLSAIVSRSDGIVDWSASVLPSDDQTHYIEAEVSHLGMGFNRNVMNLVLRELTEG